MTSSGVFRDYMGRGLEANIPDPATLSIPADTGCSYFATDTGTLYELNADGTGWLTVSGGGGGGSFKGAQIRRTSNYNVSTSDSEFIIPWETEVFDEGGFFDIAASDRLTVPAAAVSYVTVSLGLNRDNGAGGYAFSVIHHFNSAGVSKGVYKQSTYTSATMAWINSSTGPISVAPGDYFKAGYQSFSGTSPLVSGIDGCFFSIHSLG